MLIADQGQHDLILGREWLAEQRVLLNCSSGWLVWPEALESWKQCTNLYNYMLPKKIFQRKDHVNPTHQWDVECHDQSMEKLEVLPTGDWGRYYEHGQQYSYKRMKHSMETRFSTVVVEELPVVENRRNPQSAPPKQENTATVHF